MDERLGELVQALRSPRERLVEISFGETTGAWPLQVQQHVLEGLSPYFTRALRNPVFKEATEGSLSFPEDELVAWVFILFWTFHRTLPGSGDCGNLLFAIKCWVVGDKYGIAQFQDAIMLSILRRLDSMIDESMDINALLFALENTLPNAPLRELLLEWVAVEMFHTAAQDPSECVDSVVGTETTTEETPTSSEKLDGTGFYPALMAKRALLGHGDELMWRRNPNGDKDDPRWTEFFLASPDRFDSGCERCED
ncbi:unnamed protein product [Zymoseptoria tritici ST99CH_3D7]|uniref:BTB domain-containing protein n=1 Tax=Zymoseptoria tritici (strain ST99CH_3D7) TaxID=1276538 RepID=A0A1X7S675_ZYMT9|nr:unnamed protein product [Zymoseptoria tritici ST99CH_3D7]